VSVEGLCYERGVRESPAAKFVQKLRGRQVKRTANHLHSSTRQTHYKRGGGGGGGGGGSVGVRGSQVLFPIRRQGVGDDRGKKPGWLGQVVQAYLERLQGRGKNSRFRFRDAEGHAVEERRISEKQAGKEPGTQKSTAELDNISTSLYFLVTQEAQRYGEADIETSALGGEQTPKKRKKKAESIDCTLLGQKKPLTSFAR